MKIKKLRLKSHENEVDTVMNFAVYRPGYNVRWLCGLYDCLCTNHNKRETAAVIVHWANNIFKS